MAEQLVSDRTAAFGSSLWMHTWARLTFWLLREHSCADPFANIFSFLLSNFTCKWGQWVVRWVCVLFPQKLPELFPKWSRCFISHIAAFLLLACVCCLVLVMFATLVGMQWYLLMVLTCVSLVANDGECHCRFTGHSCLFGKVCIPMACPLSLCYVSAWLSCRSWCAPHTSPFRCSLPRFLRLLGGFNDHKFQVRFPNDDRFLCPEKSLPAASSARHAPLGSFMVSPFTFSFFRLRWLLCLTWGHDWDLVFPCGHQLILNHLLRFCFPGDCLVIFVEKSKYRCVSLSGLCSGLLICYWILFRDHLSWLL